MILQILYISGGVVPNISLKRSDITFSNLDFSYPMRPQYTIFENLNMTMKAGLITGNF